MEIVKWAEVCRKIEGLWPARRMTDDTNAAWFEAFGERADYATTMRAVLRLASEEDRAPSLAQLRAAYRDLDQGAHRYRPRRDALTDANEAQRRATMAVEWREVRAGMQRYPRIREMFHALQTQYGPDVTDAQALLCRMALIDELRHLTPAEIATASVAADEAASAVRLDDDPGPVEPSGDVDPFTPIGDVYR